MLIQRMFFDHTDEYGGREMFFRSAHAEADCEGRLVVPAGDTASFDTWFNMFSAAKWARYTGVRNISAVLTLRGKGSYSLVSLPEDASGQERVLFQGTYDCNHFERITVCRERELRELGAFCFLRVKADADTVIAAGEFLSGEELPREGVCRENPPRGTAGYGGVRIACCICTYKREEYVRRNAEILLREIMDNPDSPLCDKIKIYIADNGKTLSGEEFAHPGVRIFPNENYGGSAGFTRTMIEAVLREQDQDFRPTHLLLMDDDILLHPAALEKTAAFMGLIREEYQDSILGGAMLLLEERSIQAEGCGYYEVSTGSVRGTERDGMDLAKRENLLCNDSDGEANFSGWWYSCIPARLITEDNLPLPLFLHRDDQDFGLRCTERGGRILQLNGVGIWHPSPAAKHADYIAYYDMRNMLIAMMNRGGAPLPARALKRQLLVKAVQSCLGYRYDAALMCLRGCEDFCRGPEWFRALAPDRLHQELLERTGKPLIPMECVPGDSLRTLAEEKRLSAAAKIRRYLFPSGELCCAEAGCNYPSYLGHRRTIYLNPEKTAGYELVMSWPKTFAVFRKLCSVYRMIGRSYLSACADWQRGIGRFRTLAFWEQYLKL